MLAEKMKAAAAEQGIDAAIAAYPDSSLPSLIDQADVILLGPQIGFKKKKLQDKFSDKKAVIESVNSVDYGMMDGARVLKYSLELVNTTIKRRM